MIFLKFCGQFAAFDHPHFVKETLVDQNYAEYAWPLLFAGRLFTTDSQYIITGVLDFGLFRTGKNIFIWRDSIKKDIFTCICQFQHCSKRSS